MQTRPEAIYNILWADWSISNDRGPCPGDMVDPELPSYSAEVCGALRALGVTTEEMRGAIALANEKSRLESEARLAAMSDADKQHLAEFTAWVKATAPRWGRSPA